MSLLTPEGVVGKVVDSMIKAATDIGAIGKDQTNKDQHYAFRGIDQLLDKAAPAFRKHKLVCIPNHTLIQTESITSSRGTGGFRTIVSSQFMFVHADGSSVTTTAVGEGVDYGDKSANKAMAQAMKYALFQALTIPLGDIDPDAESPDIQGSGRPAKEPRGSGSSRTPRSNKPTSNRPANKPAASDTPQLIFTEADRDDEGWWPSFVCPSCGSDVHNKMINTKNGQSPLWECTNFQGCRDWPGRTRKDGDGFYPWSEFGSEDNPEKIWGPGGWVDDHINLVAMPEREDHDGAPANVPRPEPRDDYGPDEAPF